MVGSGVPSKNPRQTRPDPIRIVFLAQRSQRLCAEACRCSGRTCVCRYWSKLSPHSIPFNSFVFLPLHHPCDRVGRFSRFFFFFPTESLLFFVCMLSFTVSCCSPCFVWAVYTYTYIFPPIPKKIAAACISRGFFFVFISLWFHLANRSSLSFSLFFGLHFEERVKAEERELMDVSWSGSFKSFLVSGSVFSYRKGSEEGSSHDFQQQA